MERVSCGAECAEREFAVVAGANGLADGGGALGLQAREKDAGFDLCAGDGRGVVDGVERGALNDDGGVAFGEGEARAHFCERLANALHGAARKRCVADEGEGALLRREQAGDHAHRGAGVAAVERMIRWSDAAADAVDFNAAVVELADLCAERPACRRGWMRSRRRWRSWRSARCLRQMRRAWHSDG